MKVRIPLANEKAPYIGRATATTTVTNAWFPRLPTFLDSQVTVRIGLQAPVSYLCPGGLRIGYLRYMLTLTWSGRDGSESGYQ